MEHAIRGRGATVIDDLAAATEPAKIAEALAPFGVGAAELARRRDAGPSSEAWDLDRLQELRSLVLLLAESLTEAGVAQWLRAPSRLLDGRRPIDVAADGDLAAVREAAASFIEGAYL